MLTFGDWEPADSYTPNGVANSLAVARRMHEDRNALFVQLGERVRRWPELDEEEQGIAIHLARVMLRGLGPNMRFERAAQMVHEERRLLSRRGDIDEWIDLDPELQDVAIELSQLIAAWLEMEGTSPSA